VLRPWKRAEPAQHRRAELMQSGERQLHLGLDPSDPRHAETGCLPRAVVQKRCLADTRVAPDDQDRALAGADVLQQPVEQLALIGSAQQHRRMAARHALTLNDQGSRPRASTGATAGDRGESCCVLRTDPVAVVTGGSCGAGREIARALASRGYAVVVVYLRDQREAERAVDEILAANGMALAVRADVTDELDVERLFTETAAAFGAVDVVVDAAMPTTAVVSQQAARQLSHGGAIVNASGSDAITSDLADELRARDITINGLSPGLEPPGAHHDIADLLALLDRWRRASGD
jgi:3-oxoacyl-[acyl-carrier protein] reductase